MWKFDDFSITLILREINFGDCESAKSAILLHLEALKFDFFYEFLQFLRDEIDQIAKIQSLQNVKDGSFRTNTFSHIDFT